MTDEKNPSINPNKAKGKINGEENLILSDSREKEEATKSENSEKINLIKNQLENFQFNEIASQEIEWKTNEWVKEKYFEVKGKGEVGVIGFIPIIGQFVLNHEKTMTSVRWKRNTEDELPKIIGDLVNISTNKILEKKDDFVKKLAELSVEVNDKETELSEKVKKLEKLLEEYDKQNRVLWGEVNKTKKWRKKLIIFFESELIKIIRPLGIEMEEIDDLVQVYKRVYWEETKNNSKEKEVKQKEARVIESELRKKIGDVNLEATIFGKCDEIAELKFESEQSWENTSRFEAKIETRLNT